MRFSRAVSLSRFQAVSDAQISRGIRYTERAMHAYRTHTCGELNKDNVGSEARLSGWVHRVRDHGGLLFIDLRDHYTAIVLNSHLV